MFLPTSYCLWMLSNLLIVFSSSFSFFSSLSILFYLFLCCFSLWSPVPAWGQQASPPQARFRAVVPGADGWLQPALSSPSASQGTVRPQACAAGRGPSFSCFFPPILFAVSVCCDAFAKLQPAAFDSHAEKELDLCVCVCERNKDKAFTCQVFNNAAFIDNTAHLSFQMVNNSVSTCKQQLLLIISVWQIKPNWINISFYEHSSWKDTAGHSCMLEGFFYWNVSVCFGVKHKLSLCVFGIKLRVTACSRLSPLKMSITPWNKFECVKT